MFKISRRYIFFGLFILSKALLYLFLEYSYLFNKKQKKIKIKNKFKSSGAFSDKNIIVDVDNDEYELDNKFFTDRDKKQLWRELSNDQTISIEYHGFKIPLINNHLKIINIS